MLEFILESNVIFYLMAIVGFVGVLAKVITRFTVRRLVRSAAVMQKSTHKLMKLVRSKYEHACMAHDKVDNTKAFVDKFIFEYRTLGLRLHTWQMLQRQSIWFTTVLAVIGAGAHYYANGVGEAVYQYAMTGIALDLLLTTIYQLSDEKYQLKVVQVYMVDYLENVHAYRYQKMKQQEKEKLNIINPEAFTQADKPASKDALAIHIEKSVEKARSEGKKHPVRNLLKTMPKEERKEKRFSEELELLEAEDLTAEDLELMREDAEKPAEVKASETGREKTAENQAEETSLRVEAIRHILEEFLA